MYKKFLTKKEVVQTKETISMLKKKKKNLHKSKEFAKMMIDNVIDRKGMVIDYMENLEMFRECMEG
jgi:prefoldin subunit 5